MRRFQKVLSLLLALMLAAALLPGAALASAQADEPTEEPTGEPAELLTEEPAEAPLELLTEEPAEAPLELPAQEPAEAPAERRAAGPTALDGGGTDFVEDYTLTAEELAHMLVGENVTVTDAKMTGLAYSASGCMDALGISGGVALDSYGENSSEDDEDLAALVQAAGMDYGGDTATLEFTMTANGTLLNFNYVFSSCEFDQPEYFNDIFGLFVSVNGGPFENIAKLDNGQDVSITNLRAGKDGTVLDSGADTDIGDPGTVYDYFKVVDGAGFGHETEDEVNGVSNVFNAQKTVAVGDTVTVKFAIADVGDTDVNSYVVIENGSLSFVPKSNVDYADEELTELDAGGVYEITVGGETPVTYTLTASADGTVPLMGQDDNGLSYNFVGETLSIVKKGDGDEPDSEAQELPVAERPDAPDDPSFEETTPYTKPEDVVLADLEATETSFILTPRAGQEYSVDGGSSWLTAGADGKIVIPVDDPEEEITIVTRFAASGTSFVSEASSGLTIKLSDMMKSFHFSVDAVDVTYSGGTFRLSIDPKVDGVEIAYSEAPNALYTSSVPAYTDVCSKTIYYRVTKSGYFTAYGSQTLDIAPRTLLVTPAAGRCKLLGAADGDAFAYTFSGQVDGQTPGFTGALGREAGETAGAYDITVGSLALADNGVFKAANYTLSLADETFGIYSVEASVAPEQGAPSATLDNSDAELIDALLTDEEKEELADGEEVIFRLEVKLLTAEEASAAERSQIGAAAKKLIDGEAKIAYLDISLFKKLGSADEVQVTLTNKPLRVTIVVPEDIRKDENGQERAFYLFHAHDDGAGLETKRITPESYDPETGELTFLTSGFSTYALSYKLPAASPVSVPHTGDTADLLTPLAASGLALLGLCALAVLAKKRRAADSSR